MVTEFALSEFLVGQQDKRLAAASRPRRARRRTGRRRGTYGDAPPPDPLRALGQGEGTLAVVQNGSGAQGAVLDSSVGVPSKRKPPFKDLPKGAGRWRLLALPSDGKQHSIDLGGSLGEYRVVSTTSPRGERRSSACR